MEPPLRHLGQEPALPAHAAADDGAFSLYDEKVVRDRLERRLSTAELIPLEDAYRAPARAGIYLLFFTGESDNPLYGRLAGKRWPIYVGRAKHGLQRRLLDHQRSVRKATNLRLSDFAFAYLPCSVSESSSLEDLALEHYLPTWNRALTGFGNKLAGEGRKHQKVSCWDRLHPGRVKSTRRERERDRLDLISGVEGHLETTLPRRRRSR